MRARSAIVTMMLAMIASFVLPGSVALATTGPVFAQGEETGGGTDGEGTDEGEEESQSDPEAETDPGEGEAAEPETGPLWTYQMARIALAGLVPLIAFMAYLYWRFVIRAARGEG